MKILPSLPRSVPGASPEFTTYAPNGIGAGRFTINITDVSGEAPELTVSVEGRDAQGEFRTLVSSPALTIKGETVLIVEPDFGSIPGHASRKVQATLFETCRLSYRIEGPGASFTFSADAEMI